MASEESGLQERTISTTEIGPLKVYIQGNLNDKQGRTVFLTVHDIGTNHREFVDFANEPSMGDVTARSVFLHVCLPGQGDNAADIEGTYPTLQQIGQELVCVLDELQVRTCVGFGAGLGANIICRFAVAHPNRVLGVILVHCTSTTAGVLEYIKDKYINMRLESVGMNQTAYEYLIFHKFGSGQDASNEHVNKFIDALQTRQNANNLSKLLQAFVKRTDLSGLLAKQLKVDALLVTGARASHVHTVYTTHQSMSREKTTLLVVDGVGDVITETPERLTRTLILFCKGCGVLTGVTIPGMERQRTLSSSMEEADRPRNFSPPAK